MIFDPKNLKNMFSYFRRGHIVLKDSLPKKTEHVLFVRMTDVQRRLYRRFMEELITNKCVSNPLKAFAVCCKIWNHPDVLYDYMNKREEDDLDVYQEDALSPRMSSPTPSNDSLGRKEEINYDWAQVYNTHQPNACLKFTTFVIFHTCMLRSMTLFCIVTFSLFSGNVLKLCTWY